MELGSLHSYLKKAGPVPAEKLFPVISGIAAGTNFSEKILRI